jgi:hypothetical protein
MFGKKGILFIFIFLSMIAVGVAAVTIYNKPMPSGGTIVYPPPPPTLTLEVYKDSDQSIVVTAIDWGSLHPGENKTYTVYLKNGGNTPGTLSLALGGWSPTTASQYITVTWDRKGAVLQAGGVIDATMKISISKQIMGIDTFNVNIIFTISG